jgi:O-methyltransferase / aklanonic acid methyltransferase
LNWTHSNHPQFKQEVVAIYDRASATYDRVGARFFSYFGQFLVSRLSILEGAYVLDVATGRGALLFPVSEHIGSRGRVVGVDLAPAMVRHTAQEIAQHGVENCLILQMDADQIGFTRNAFDYVLCGSALFFLIMSKPC